MSTASRPSVAAVTTSLIRMIGHCRLWERCPIDSLTRPPAFHLRYPAQVPPSPEKEAGPCAAGLCAACLHARRIESSHGSVFYLCELSHTDPRFPKYPRLPVLSCDGFRQKP